MMTGKERVIRTIKGLETDRQPIYGWLWGNLEAEITERWGSVADFEDKYEFDIAHIFGGPCNFNYQVLNELKAEYGELTPDLLVDKPIYGVYDREEDYAALKASFEFQRSKDRFCYVQTPGFFECHNDVFGIENQLMWVALYPEELSELYRRQSEWTLGYVDRCIDMGLDMIHISDDWGSQKDIMFNPDTWREIVYPHLKRVVDHVHERGAFCSLHSDGCVMQVADDLAKVGLDVIHPWQENAGMSYDVYLDKYADKFAILGGVCVQSAIGILPKEQLESEIRRVFGKLRGKRWIVCTTHFVQKHCSMDDLEFAYDLIYKLAREQA